MNENRLPKVAVLMSAYNGERYLAEQIDSILAQKGVSVQLVVRDDGSSDGTLRLLDQYRQRGQLEYHQGENVGYTESFMRLCIHAPAAEYYAFADQDDVWLPDKLRAMTARLEPYTSIPALCVSEWQMVDEMLHPVPQAAKALEFSIETMQHASQEATRKAACAMNHVTASGCVQVWNNALQDILRRNDYPHIPMGHDVIVGMAAILLGKFVVYPQPTVLYRQHGANASGGHSGRAERRKRWRTHLARLQNKAGPNISECNAELLKAYGASMPEESREILQKTIGYQHGFAKKCSLLLSDYPKLLFLRDGVKFRLKVLLNRL